MKIGGSIGSTGPSLTLIIRPRSHSILLPVYIGKDIFEDKTQSEIQSDIAFYYVVKSQKMSENFLNVQELQAESRSMVPRLPVSLIGSKILQQTINVSVNDIAFLINPNEILNEGTDSKVDLKQLFMISHALHEHLSEDVENIRMDICADFFHDSEDF